MKYFNLIEVESFQVFNPKGIFSNDLESIRCANLFTRILRESGDNQFFKTPTPTYHVMIKGSTNIEGKVKQRGKGPQALIGLQNHKLVEVPLLHIREKKQFLL